MSRFYDGFADYQLGYLKHGNARIDAVHKRLLPFIRERRPQNALDIGCGIGITARWLSRHLDRVAGVDISPRNIEIAREVAPSAELSVADLPISELPEGPFDLVTLLDVVEHFPPEQRQAAFEQIGNVINEDAVIVINVPSRLFALAHQEDEGRQVIDESVGADEIVSLAARIGMEPLTIQRYGVEYAGQYVFLAFARSYDVSSPLRPTRLSRSRSLLAGLRQKAATGFG